MADWEDCEEMDEEEWAALAAAEQSLALAAAEKSRALTAAAAPPPPGGSEPSQPTGGSAAATKRKLPASLSGGSAAAPAGAADCETSAPGKRRLPASLAAPAAQRLPPLQHQGPCQYAFTGVEVDALCQGLCTSGVRHVGFDIEWLVTYEAGVTPRPVALVQLCFLPHGAHAHRCLLLHVARCGITPHLQQLLCCKDIVKVGVGAHGDALKVQRDFGFEMGGVLELSEFANARLCTDGVPPIKWSLAGLTERLLARSLDKGQGLRCSDWEQYPLTAEQRKYAALDVFASLRVYEVLEGMPVVWQPAALLPPPSSEALAAAGEGVGGGAADLIPACQEVARLQPAKLQAYQLHMQQGLTAAQIAAARHIAEDSAQGYLAEAITAGYAYSWPRLGVPAQALTRVAEAAGRLLGRNLACEPAAGHVGGGEDTGVAAAGRDEAAGGAAPGPAAQPSGAAGARGAPLAPIQAGAGREPSAPDCAAACASPTAGSGGGGTCTRSGGKEEVACAAEGRPVDVLQALLETGAKIRELKEAYWEDIPYGHIRLALAHLGRCNPGPWA